MVGAEDVRHVPQTIRISQAPSRHVLSLMAFSSAVGGTSYAAISLPTGSVGSAQLKLGAVTSSKLGRGAVNRRRCVTAHSLRRISGAASCPAVRAGRRGRRAWGTAGSGRARGSGRAARSDWPAGSAWCRRPPGPPGMPGPQGDRVRSVHRPAWHQPVRPCSKNKQMAGASDSASVSCPPGTKVIGGGASANSERVTFIDSHRPPTKPAGS